MRPLTYTRNKHAVPIANKPLIQYPFEMIVEAGIKDIAIIVNETREEIESILGDGKKWGVKITYIFQKAPKGLAHALSLSENFMGRSKFVMVLGDNMLEKGIIKYVDNFRKSNSKGHILGIKVDPKEHKRFGTATINKKGEVLAYLEKPGVVDKSNIYDPDNSYVVPGFYFAGPEIFGCFHGKGKLKPSSRGEYEIPHAFNWLINHDHKVTLDVVDGWYKDPGNPGDTLIANQFVLTSIVEEKNKGKVNAKSKIEGKVNIGKKTVIKNSILRGPLIIGENCKIENCFIGPFTSIYHNSELKNCEIENSIVLGNTKLHDTPNRIDSSIICWDCEVGKLDGPSNSLKLFIGDNSSVMF